jgi:hypothetical protein
MFIVENLEIGVIAIAKTFHQEVVNENHLLIAACDFLCKHEPEKCLAVFKKAASAARNFENGLNASGFQTPTIPEKLSLRIKGCNSVDDVVNLVEECIVNELNESSVPRIEEPSGPARVGNFHEPLGPLVGIIPKIIPNKETTSQLIKSFLLEEEFYAWDGPYNTKDQILATRAGQSMGRLFVTNKRLLFWSDDLAKPHAGLFYGDIQGWKTSWMPLKSRGVIAIVAGRKVVFAANSTAIENAERYIKR